MSEHQDEATRFLRLLWGGLPEGCEHKILIWRLEGKHSRWFTGRDIESASYRCFRNNDLFVGCGLAPSTCTKSSERCPIESVVGIPGVWADVDVKDGAAESIEQARKIIDLPGITPSIVVSSGGGLQAWWLFERPWLFAQDPGNREDASELCASWVSSLEQRARESYGIRGLDHVGDLARVMRIPGTVNSKYDDGPRHVRIAETNDNRVASWESLRRYLVIESKPEAATLAVDGRPIDINAKPPQDLFNTLLVNSEKFADTWLHRRKDLDCTDESAVEFSLAWQAIDAGWNDRDIEALIIDHRRTYDPAKLEKITKIPKSGRPSVVHRTIARARESYAGKQFETPASAVRSIEHEEDENGGIPALIKAFGGLPIESVHKLGDIESTYSLKLFNGAIIGLGADLWNTRRIRQTVANASKTHGKDVCLIPPALLKAVAWDRVVRIIVDVAIDESLGDGEGTHELCDQIRDYLYDSTNHDQLADAITAGEPVVNCETIMLNVPHLVNWLVKRGKYESREVRQVLRALGFEPRQRTARDGDLVNSRWYWEGRFPLRGRERGDRK